MTRALVVLLSALCFAGCGGQAAPPRASFQSKHWTSTASVGLWRLRFADEIPLEDRRLAEAAARAHFGVMNDLHWAVVYHLGQSYPTRTLDVMVHPGVSLGSPYSPAEVEWRVDATGALHLALGRGAVLPSLVHGSAHLFWAPLHAEDETTSGLVPYFWTEVMDRQRVSVNQLKLRRGVP